MNIRCDPLRPANRHEIEQLLKTYELLLPRSVQFLSLLRNIARMRTTLRGASLRDASHRFRKTIYIPNRPNDNQYATFVAIGMAEDLQVMVNTLEDPPTELEHAIRKSIHIKWHQKPLFVTGGDNGIRESLHKVAFEKGIQVDIISDCTNYWIPWDKAINISYVVPDDVELKPLRLEHAPIIDDWWPYRYSQSLRFFESIILHNGSFGLFDKHDSKLVACVIKNDHDGIGHLYTVPERSGRGYGTTLAKAMTKQIAEEHSHSVHTFIAHTNTRSIRLFEKLGFIPVNRTQWHQM